MIKTIINKDTNEVIMKINNVIDFDNTKIVSQAGRGKMTYILQPNEIIQEETPDNIDSDDIIEIEEEVE